MHCLFPVRFFRIFLCVGFLIYAYQLSAQVQYINFKHYSLSDGLSSYKVVKILQDRFGFMWIATQDGLNRFDGKDIIIYNKSAREKHLLLGGDITDMVEDSAQNTLWVTTSYGGLNGINLKTGTVQYSFSVADTENRFPDQWIRTILQNGNDLLIGTYNGISVFNIKIRKFSDAVLAPPEKVKINNERYDIHLFFKDEFGRIWAFSDFGIVVYSGDDYSIISARSFDELGLPEGYKVKRFNCYQIVKPGQFLLATNSGIKKITYDASPNFISVEEKILAGAGKEINYLRFDDHRNLWFATVDGLYKKSRVGGVLDYVEDVNLVDRKKWTNSINTIFFDQYNNLWLGTLQGFAIATQLNTPFVSFFQSADLKTKIDRANYIFPVNDTTEYVCAWDGFFTVENPSKKIRRLKEGSFWHVFRHQDGNFILGGSNRVFVFRPPDQFIGIEKIYPELTVISNETIMSSVNLGDSVLFLGSENQNGVYEWNYKRRKIEKLNSISNEPLESGIVNAIYKDKGGRLWILSDNSFAIYNPVSHQLINYKLRNPDTGQPLTFYFDICESSGFYWLACYGSGIVQLDEKLGIKKIISTNDRLNNAGLYKLLVASDSTLFCTSNNGLSRLNTKNLSISNYFETDGLHSNAFEEFCGIVYNGKIYAGGPDGFTIINPRYITTNAIAPELYISNIIIETQSGQQDISDLQMRSVTFPRSLLQATVYFSALNYSNPERTTYKYRIKGQHDDWIELGTQNFVNLIGLKPDDYSLQVQSFNEDGVAGDIKEIQLVFLPQWYQTTWFKILLVVLVTALVYALYKIRINQLKKEKEIRTHLASDLHDDLGSTLNSVKVYANMAMLEKENNKYLEKIKESTQEAIIGVRDIIWILDDKKDSLDHLMTRIGLFAVPLCNAGAISFRSQLNDSLRNYKLGKEEKRNLYMIIKEAINNSIKYAKGSLIHLTIDNKETRLTIKIVDDGVGFEKDKLTEGNGLKNIMNRSIQIGYKAIIISQPEQGTTIQLEKT
ncbi:MAG TPA: triple tyrosine motif-containing protein [Chitinophagaceae bacterium]|nr:triple tyrosine motif-containing protein [Chitinophagaceae bacterium]